MHVWTPSALSCVRPIPMAFLEKGQTHKNSLGNDEKSDPGVLREQTCR